MKSRLTVNCFFYDSNDAIGMRSNWTNCPIEIISKIEARLREKNPFAKGYFMLKEIKTTQNDLAKQRGEKPREIKLAFGLRDELAKRRYNVPTANEVAAIFVVDAAGEILLPANVVVHQKGKKELKTTPIMSKVLEPMTYPLFYPNRNYGWRDALTKRGNTKKLVCVIMRVTKSVSETRLIQYIMEKCYFSNGQWTITQKWNKII